MNIKPDDATLKALARLGNGADWELIETWLVKSREAAVQSSLSPDPTKSRQAQGALMAIDEFLRNTRSAVELSTRR